MIYTAWLLLAVAFVYLSVIRKSLTPPAALTAVSLGAIVIATHGTPWLLPLFTFFGSSTLIGRLLPVEADAGDSKDRQPRDVVQVLCNGGVYGFVALLGLPPILLLVSMAVATSDTWASEIGKYIRQPTYDILRWRRVPPGLSGGISWSGTGGGAAGAALIATLGFLLLPAFSATEYLVVSGFGFLGMLVDSVLGAALQARYDNGPAAGLSDTPLPHGHLAHGLSWMTNDLVNLLSIALVTLLAYLVLP
ncbi:DUF92 domain-containing protein [Neolewinella sp.]|uniref:DUF92 domain-containing protein n=1 Tax=Neolewinella sp. TaxID=2993543 RepID=UPI003B52BFFD